MPESNFMIILTTSLFFLTLLPSVYLRYLPFRTVLTEKQRHTLFLAYAAIFVFELALSLLLFFSGALPFSFHTFKIIFFFFGFLPYFLLNLCLIRPYAAQHFFILGIQFLLAAAISTAAVLLTILYAGLDGFFDCFAFYCALYLLLYLAVLPFVLPFFRQIFLRFSTVSTDRFWLYICPLPLLMFFHDIYFSISEELLILHHLPARLLLFISGILISLAAWRGLEQILRQAATTERNLALLTRMNSIGEYTRSLQDKQRRLALVRHDLRHNSKMLADLISHGEDEAAMKLIGSINEQIDATHAEHFAANPLIDAALSVYVQQSRQKGIPIETKLDVPPSFAAEIDLSLVLCNLLENAIHAEEKEEKAARGIRILARAQGRGLFLAIENRRSAPVPLAANGLPKSRESLPGHGYGTRSLLDFTKKYGAEYFTEQKDGWFSILLHLPLHENKSG